jgi:RNA polymerase sigma-70 factor (ECF subfamily)
LPDDGQLWRQWLARHGPALGLFARQWVTGPADAEDAVQEGFIRFWRARGRANNDVGYLYACVRTAAIDLSRTRSRQRRVDERAKTPEVACPFAENQDELADAVESSLAQLPLEQREVIVMKIWGGLTFAQIGDALKINPNTAASRYRYALQRLETLLCDEVIHD